ncbi:hypothetical protein OHC33_001780 [Knufia fluminis]|uniref:Uncharacterized protein n=1 Tax=Knufia fluminis TaxID=191047 RepID=A0AAN8EZR8_9EURO|nr:hypothetical protein OHC33_001780 [Knufia fluminis]
MPETLHELRMTSEAEVLLDARERNKSSTIQPDCTSPRLNSLADAHLQSMRPNPSPYGPRPEQRLKNISDLPVDTTACEVLERERQNKPLKGCFFLHAPDSHSLVEQWMHYSDIMYRQHSNPRSPLNHIRWPFEHAETLQMQLLARQGSGGEAALVLKKVTISPFTALVRGYYASAMTGYGLEPAKTSPRQQSGAPKLLAYQAAALSDADVFS